MAAQESEDDFLKKHWYVVVDDLVGGWAISTTNLPLSQQDFTKGERHWIEVHTEKIANYIADLHNRSLQ